MNLSTTQISFLKDVQSNLNVDSKSGWRYRFFQEFSIYEISTFIKLIEDDKIYMIIPQFASSKSLSQARLNLCEDFLVNNKSNPMLITKFILEQWNNSGFNINQGNTISFCFKFKRVWLTYK
jgi:hypothetical protein